MSYDSSSIKVLSEIEHIRLNPNMYISTTQTPVHLIEEAFDNCIDEAITGNANVIAINLDTKNNIYSIIDNGRGIPISNNVAITISSKLFSGAKFTNSKSAYKICSGLHGVGLVTIFALSKKYSVEIYRNNKHAIYNFTNSKLKSKKIKPFNNKNEKPFSTKIQFTPNKDFFESTIPDINRIRRRILSAAVELPNCLFSLNIDGKLETIKINKEEFLRDYILTKSEIDTTPWINIIANNGIEKFGVSFCYSFNSTNSPKILSSVNLLPVKDGGSHVNFFMDILRNFFLLKAKKKGIRFLAQDVTIGLRSYFSLSLIKPKLAGQSKEKLENSRNDLESLITKLSKEIENYFSRNEIYLNELLESFENYRRILDSKKVKTKTGSRSRFTKFTKLMDCISRDGELFIVEGDSAGGSYVQCRDPRKHAILPLKGKIPSAVKAKDILKNKEICEMMDSFGTGAEPSFDISGLRYGKIIISADADADGGHILCLLIMNLAILVPEIIKQGYLYASITPFYAVVKNKLFIPIYDDEDLQKKKKEYPNNIIRIKGLGELSPNQLKICAIDEKTRKLVKVNFSDNMKKLNDLFMNADTKKLLVDGKFEI